MIQEADILRCDDSGVTYRWRDGKTGRYQQRTVGGAQFLHRVMQHVLPKRLRRSRSYGLLRPNGRASLLELLVFKAPPPALPTPRAASMRCRCGGAPMRIILRRVPPRPDGALCATAAVQPSRHGQMAAPPPPAKEFAGAAYPKKG